ncbi:MAG: helix-turn-helix transcriptional regulator [Cellulosilyticum sp.]|nr:helix-turn-helix transcriptional regulator [Cellulosilyticum sp.]
MELEILYICEKAYPNVTASFTQSTLHTHYHPEISIILSGNAQYLINNRTYTLKAGELVILSPGTSHSVVIPKQNSYHDLHLGINHLVGHMDDVSTHFSDGFFILDLGDLRKNIFDICKSLIDESNKRQSDYMMMLETLTLQLLIHLARLIDYSKVHETQSISNMVYPDKQVIVEWIKDYIQQNYMKEISLEMFSKDMYLSQVYISKIFKEVTGHSPIHFLIQTRLSIAKKLLETESLPIKEVSSLVGYEDAYHFSKLFKKYYGYSPSDIKKMSRINKAGYSH